ncbi:hypothetical protein LOTGIDRAFT_123476 [Lottia gigantea]|uniref:AN1-type domain-containing protein n=1 Tax=Lottia gigantea TaxID=225164 RepID=V4A5Q9_LOTGI|nr:hypothetical protein LOTGIDRAFT_123476 [Lottia gigantea]ESO90325.1 hypothetical protein LOTGIDRAFT_123476 [Lottia gigantea]
MAEFSEVGKHCSVSDCKQLDFLPFDCDRCGLVFCKLHKATDNHQCSQHLKVDSRPEYHGPKGISCFYSDCKNRELTPIPCIKCYNSYCLKHRHAQDHDCKVLQEETINKELDSKTTQHVKEILASKEPVVKKQFKKGSKSAKTAAKVALMKIKMTATGNKSIPDSEKIFLQIHLPQKSSTKSKNLFFSKKWSVGKIIDYTADISSLNNTNNTGDPLKLRIFNSEDGDMIKTDEIMENVINNDSIPVYSGSSIILEYVTVDQNSLSNYHTYPLS